VVKKIRKERTCEEAFALLDQGKFGYLTITGLQESLPRDFGITLAQQQFLTVLKHMNPKDDGVITLEEFTHFYNKVKNTSTRDREGLITLEGIFKSLLDVMRKRNLTLSKIFFQTDIDKKGYLTIEEFVDLLSTIGHSITKQKALDFFLNDNPKFDNKISYKILDRYIKIIAERHGMNEVLKENVGSKLFLWRDKSVEALLKVLNPITDDYGSYFSKFDSNHDNVLTLREFRDSIKYLKAVTHSQTERLLVLLATDKDYQPCVSIPQLQNFLSRYIINSNYTGESTLAEELLVDEDLFVSIVQHFDAFMLLNTKSYNLSEMAKYLVNHKEELKVRGCGILSNAMLMERILKEGKSLVLDFRDLLGNIANSILEHIKKEMQAKLHKKARSMTFNIVQSYKVPELDPKHISVTKTSKWTLPSGCVCYKGIYEPENKPVIIHVYSTNVLGRISSDGKTYKHHLELELSAQLLMYSKEPELAFKILGKYEKKIGIGEQSVEQYVVFEDIPENSYISLETFLEHNGGLLEIPLLKNTETALYIAKLWADDILRGLTTLHNFGFILRYLRPDHLYLKKENSRIVFGHFRDVGQVDFSNKLVIYPDILINSKYKDNPYKDSYLSPDHILSLSSTHTVKIDTWGLGAILHAILIGKPPASYFNAYKYWANSHNALITFKVPLIPPSKSTFLYTPIIYLNEDEGKEKWTVKEYLKDMQSKCKKVVSTVVSGSYSAIVKGASSMEPFKEKKEKSSLGVMFDVIACCLSTKASKRPSLKELIDFNLFQLDSYERSSAEKFLKSIFLYRSPLLCISLQCKTPLREYCLQALKSPNKLLSELETPIISIIDMVIKHIHTITTPYIQSIERILIESTQRASPHAPLAKEIIEEKVIDMLIFLCLRYTRLWTSIHRKEIEKVEVEEEELAMRSTGFDVLKRMAAKRNKSTGVNKSFIKRKQKYIDYNDLKKEKARKEMIKKEKMELEKENKDLLEVRNKFEESTLRRKKVFALKLKEQNRVLKAMCGLMHQLLLEMQFRDSVMAPFVENILNYITKLMIGEDYMLGSDNPKMNAFFKTTQDKSDPLDKEWDAIYKNRHIIFHDTFWNYTVYASVLSMFQGNFEV